ncbi:MAG: hypothetical protein SH807_09160 [Blastochloris sp.]|nr:hypothetical protein [Blastochloris sp.]
MSENKTSGASKPAAATPAPAAAPAAVPAAKTEKTTASSSTSTTVQNGKGSAPRNISEGFRSNYKGISWSTGGKLSKGERFVKKY